MYICTCWYMGRSDYGISPFFCPFSTGSLFFGWTQTPDHPPSRPSPTTLIRSTVQRDGAYQLASGGRAKKIKSGPCCTPSKWKKARIISRFHRYSTASHSGPPCHRLSRPGPWGVVWAVPPGPGPRTGPAAATRRRKCNSGRAVDGLVDFWAGWSFRAAAAPLLRQSDARSQAERLASYPGGGQGGGVGLCMRAAKTTKKRHRGELGAHRMHGPSRPPTARSPVEGLAIIGKMTQAIRVRF